MSDPVDEPGPQLGVRPLSGWHFDADAAAAELGRLTSPAYDLLLEGEAAALRRASRFNIVSLIEPHATDPAGAAGRYAEAADRLRSWRRSGVVRRDPRPALYVYEQVTGSGLRTAGLIAAVGVPGPHDPTAVLPHERVAEAPVADRYALMRATGADLEPVLLSYRDDAEPTYAGDTDGDQDPVARTIDATVATRALWTARTGDGAVHRVWRLDDPAVIAELTTALRPRRALIADGHHRWAAHRRRVAAGVGPAEALALLVPQDHAPLRLEPIHRMLPGRSLPDLVEQLPDGWRALDLDGTEDPGLDPEAVVLTDGRSQVRLQPPLEAAHPDEAVVFAVDERLLPGWKVDPADVRFHHDRAAAVAAAAPGSPVLLMPPVRFEQVYAAAERGRLLPRKATSFQPKPPDGLVLRMFDD